MEKEIYKSQITTLKLAKKYLKNCRNKGVEIETSPLCDFVTWSNCLGYQKLLLLNDKRISPDSAISPVKKRASAP